jgi:arylsulfatase A-like enzyme
MKHLMTRSCDPLARTVVAALALAGLFSPALSRPARSAPPSSRPNVLLIITDQQRADMLSCAGNRYVKTPAVDSLAASGIRFERAYCANPVCSPSRFSMMTGVLPSRIGMDRNMKIPADRVGPDILHNALGRVFHDAGYETVYGGKIHLPAASKKNTKAYGFDYLTSDERDVLADKCVEFLRRPHDRPFLLVASFINPHDICFMAIDAEARAGRSPEVSRAVSRAVVERVELTKALRLPEGVSREDFFRQMCPPLPSNFEIPQGEPPAVRQIERFSFRAYAQEHWTPEQWRLHRWAYARLTERSDGQIGRVLAALRAAGLENNTLVVFTSDHGEMDASHKLAHKSMPYEEALHIPLILSWKSVTAPGRVDTTHLASTGLDLTPTLCDFAGVAVPSSLKGRSLKLLAAGHGPNVNWRDTLVSENERSRIVRSDRFKYAVYDHGNPREMLIDEPNDPGEMHNLAQDAKYRDVLVSHRALLRQWYKDNGETLDPVFVVPDKP